MSHESRIIAHLLRFALADLGAPIHEDHTVADLHHGIKVMLDQNHGLAKASSNKNTRVG